MKKILIFGLGLLVGVIMSFLFFFVLYQDTNNEIQYFQNVGECITKNDLEIFQVLEEGALAQELKTIGSGIQVPTDLTVLIYSDSINFYDNQKIKIPKNKCARQIGVYKYKTIEKKVKTVPIVEIRE